MSEKRVTFSKSGIAWLLVAPQLIITLLFFIWPASQALYQSLWQEDAFGINREFVGFDNFLKLFADPSYQHSFVVTIVFSVAVAGISMGFALLLACKADKLMKGNQTYKTFLLWPYAIAPAVAGALWWFMFNPTIGLFAYAARGLGYDWNHFLNGEDALILVIIASAWKQISYNFLFFLAGLQSIPKSLIEAAAIDGACSSKRFWTIIFPLLSPTTFFLIVVNCVYAFFDTFAVIHSTTRGGPSQATQTLIYKVYKDGVEGNDWSSAGAQSVILMIIVCLLTIIQFRFIERRVHY